MGSATVLCIFLGLFCSIQFAVGSSKAWKCNLSAKNDLLTFDCACSSDFHEMIYHTDEFVCDTINESYSQIKNIKFQNCLLSQINNKSFQIGKFKSLKRLYMENNNIQLIDGSLFDQDSDVNELYANKNNITGINKNSFKHVKNLTELSLQKNSINRTEGFSIE